MDYGIVGVGSIASAIVTGLCKGPNAPTVRLSPRNAERAAMLAERFPSVEVASDNQAAIEGAKVVILALRPADVASVLDQLVFTEDQTVVSVMAGVSLAKLAPLVAPARDIARAIPLPAVARCEGTTPIYPATEAATALFSPLGGVVPLDRESALEAVSVSSATVSAHMRYLDAIARWLVERGIPGPQATRLVATVFAGLAPDLESPEVDFSHLAADHATPGGLNECFARLLDEAGVFETVHEALEKTAERAR
ncbi:NAD(P)-binding domain-containing protein [Consotaella salsifontis]|uniref:Pyrroline-5-carboxylate reductase n=1 Tax=Consotaella salsifontis TaxID=1365950 RepID=A0A1T4R938_9HYPH|nr:NAD(P)-binding domain-containing protein [Consotaella salsifontis]SKA12449.1 pyrroline-5-carboxylate reductase [Consotaella salsifontis]